MFANKYVGNAVKWGGKLGSDAVSFGNKVGSFAHKYQPIRKFTDTLHTINNIAAPAAAIGAAYQPEFAPALAAGVAISKGVEGVSNAVSHAIFI